MAESLTKKITGGFLLALCLLVVTGLVSSWSTKKLIKAMTWVAHTHQVLAELDDILLQLERAQSAHHEYVLTGDEQYLDAYHSVEASMKKEIADVRELVPDNFLQQQRLTVLETLLMERFTQLRQSIDLRQREGFNVALKGMFTENGNHILATIRKEVQEMEYEEWQHLTDRSAAANVSATQAMAFVIGGTLLGVLFLVSAYLILARNLTKHQETIEALQESERRYRNLYESIRDGIVVVAANGVITSVNKEFASLSGWTEPELVGSHCRKIFTEATALQEEERRSRALAIERLPSSHEAELLRKDGTVLPVEVYASFLRDEGGQIIAIQEMYRSTSLHRALTQHRLPTIHRPPTIPKVFSPTLHSIPTVARSS